MPRMARVKSEDAIYHIMARSISEVDLFKNDADKEKYISIIKDYKKIYDFKVYAYCFMSNHLHLIIDANGADISKIMHCINFKYAQYFNHFYGRHGHLFQDRFKSKIVSNSIYLMTLSAYIHNNSTAIFGFEENPEKYFYSSLGVYIGFKKDPFEILDEEFILGLFGKNIKAARKNYMQMVMKSKYEEIDNVNNEEVEFENDKTEYRSERKILIRDFKEETVINYVVQRLNIDRGLIYIKNNKNAQQARAIIVLLLRKLCNSSCKNICSILGNITQSSVSRLSSMGISLIKDDKYNCLIEDFIKY